MLRVCFESTRPSLLGSRNPEVFGALAMLSGDSWPEPPNGLIEGNVWSELVYDYSAPYSPNPDNPPSYFELPVARPAACSRPDPTTTATGTGAVGC